MMRSSYLADMAAVLVLAVMLTIAATIALGAAESGGDFDPFGSQPQTEPGVRLKDLVTIQGVRDNQLHGIGIVVGLPGTGDKNSATLRMLRAVLERNRLTVNERDLSSRNVAMVAITADLPAFTRAGTRLPTIVSTIGDANSLKDGILLQTPLVAADGRIYAVAQGPVTLGGNGDAGPELVAGGRRHENSLTVATMLEGAIVEREVPATLLYGDRLQLVLNEPDFTTAHAVAGILADTFGPEYVEAADAATISLGFQETPTDDELVGTIAQLEALRVVPDMPARVVINERTGTVVVGSEVRISEAAVSHAGLSVRVLPQVRTRVVDPRDPSVREEETVYVNQISGRISDLPPPGVAHREVPGTLNVIQGATVEELANALNALGARPSDLVAIFQALHRAGALHAELVVM